MFYPPEGYRSVTPLDAARVNRTILGYRSVTPLDAARVDRTILDLNNALSEGKRIYFEVVIMQLQFLQFSAVTRCSVQSPEEVREVRCPRTSYQVGTILVVGVVGVWPTTEGIRMYS